MSDWRVSPRYLRRIRSVYLLDSALSENLRCVYPGEHLLVNRNTLIKTIEAIAARFDISSSLAGMPRKPERVVLLLNPFTQRGTANDRRDRLALLAKVCSFLQERSFDVVIKDHPREQGVLSQQIFGRQASKIKLRELPNELPAEFFASHYRFRACVSTTSASLFYLPSLFGIEPFTFVHWFDASRFGRQIEWARDVVLGYVPKIESLGL